MAVRSVLEDDETAILDLEGQVELFEKRVRDVETFTAVGHDGDQGAGNAQGGGGTRQDA